MRFALGFRWGAAVVLWFALPSVGSAYCRTTTAESLASSCPEVCQLGGMPLYWPSRDLSYILNRRGFPDLPESTVRSVLETSFRAWEQVSCEGGESVDLTIEQLPGTTDLEVGPRQAEPNDNVIVHIPAEDWDDDPRAFAITKIWYNKNNGHILGADMQFNGRMDPFGVCPSGGCQGDTLTDLRNVVTHEAGHFLGLAHSDDPDSTMWCDAAPGDVDKRDLGSDDAAGLCAIYGPNARPDPDAASAELRRRPATACSLAPGRRAGDGLGLWLLGLVGLGLWRGRRGAQ